MSKIIKYIIPLIIFILTSKYSITQPSPIDKGMDPGGELGTPGNALGAPIDDFIPGLLLISIIYAIYKLYQIRSSSKTEMS